jgi:hypothetical protein
MDTVKLSNCLVCYTSMPEKRKKKVKIKFDVDLPPYAGGLLRTPTVWCSGSETTARTVCDIVYDKSINLYLLLSYSHASCPCMQTAVWRLQNCTFYRTVGLLRHVSGYPRDPTPGHSWMEHNESCAASWCCIAGCDPRIDRVVQDSALWP